METSFGDFSELTCVCIQRFHLGVFLLNVSCLVYVFLFYFLKVPSFWEGDCLLDLFLGVLRISLRWCRLGLGVFWDWAYFVGMTNFATPNAQSPFRFVNHLLCVFTYLDLCFHRYAHWDLYAYTRISTS